MSEVARLYMSPERPVRRAPQVAAWAPASAPPRAPPLLLLLKRRSRPGFRRRQRIRRERWLRRLRIMML